MPPENQDKKITELLYEHNLELSVKNKTLSLLERLYQTSVLTLAPEVLAETITAIIREDLNMEFSGIFLFEKESDILAPLSFSKSDHLSEIFNNINFQLKNINITDVMQRAFFKQVLFSRTANITNNLEDIFVELVNSKNLEILKNESHIKTVLIYPLIRNYESFGALIFGLNREYNTLNKFEKDSIKSFINVISLALDKAFLYKNLQDANEKLKSLDKLKTEFLSLASHQLRSPLTAIKGYTSMLMTGDFGAINDKQKEAIGRVFESSDHLAKVVEDLLNVSKIEMGGMQYVMSPFDFEKAARDLANDLSITAQKKGLKLTFETDGKAPYTVNGDMEKIRQVILNLLDNSIKYTKEGSITVKLSKDENVKNLLLAITDTGMGMTPEIKETLFQKFARGDGMKVNTSGSGLGLYLAKQIVEGHKGHVWVESDGPGKGATFFVDLGVV